MLHQPRVLPAAAAGAAPAAAAAGGPLAPLVAAPRRCCAAPGPGPCRGGAWGPPAYRPRAAALAAAASGSRPAVGGSDRQQRRRGPGDEAPRRPGSDIQQQQQQQQHEQEQRRRPARNEDAAWDEPRAPPQQQVITVGANSSLAGAARALVQQLDAFGSAELWCTGVTGQVSGIGVLVTAQEMLASRSGGASGLAATLQQAAPDGDPGDQKRSIRKLVIAAVPAPPPEPERWAGPGGRTSTGTVRALPELAAALRAGIDGPEGGHALEARGEQGVNRALRAVLALQAEMGEPLAVWPWYGAVADAAAAARGEEKVVPGTVLLVRRCQA